MTNSWTKYAASALACAISLALCVGCSSGGSASYESYIPSEDAAQRSLEAALTAWQDGQKPGKIQTASPAIQAVDSRWRAGEKLMGYEVLAAEPGEGPRCFSVRLRTSGGKQVVKYFVLGRDPVWVYREEDYARATGMEPSK